MLKKSTGVKRRIEVSGSSNQRKEPLRFEDNTLLSGLSSESEESPLLLQATNIS